MRKGQWDAARASGLTATQTLIYIILPQAFRIILPPMGNQYLNLAKNTSLGIAVAYADIVQVGQTIYNQTGQSVPVVLVWMGFYAHLVEKIVWAATVMFKAWATSTHGLRSRRMASTNSLAVKSINAKRCLPTV